MFRSGKRSNPHTIWDVKTVNTEDHHLAEGALFTDMYQLTMAQLYYHQGMHEKTAQFDHFFRSNPDYGQHQAGYCIHAGLEWLLDWLEEARFGSREIEHLRQQTGREGKRLFEDDFLAWLRDHGSFEDLTIHSIPEGRVVHPNVSLNVVRGPLAMAQLLETALLNTINYQTLIATKAARIHQAGRGQLLLEFGMRRAQGKGANAGARASLIGGADYSSNTGLSYALGYPPKGTHAHSMVQAFMALEGSELDAFRAYADVYPDNCLLLVDTVDTLESGVPNAIKVFEELRRAGHQPLGIRLDSGDLAHLSVRAASMLNKAGFKDVNIVLSNQLDEYVLQQIVQQIKEEAPTYGVDPDHLIDRLVYGVGTRLITSQGDAALGGVYKLVSIQDGNEWHPAIKVSETPRKVPNPGQKQEWRLYDERGKATADLVGLEDEDPRTMEEVTLRHPTDASTYRFLPREQISEVESLLTKVYSNGQRTQNGASIETMRQRREEDINRLDSGVRRIVNPHIYHVSLTESLWNLKQDLIQSMGKRSDV